MDNRLFLPKIETIFDPQCRTYNQALYNEMIRNALEAVLSESMVFLQDNESIEDPDIKADQYDQFLSLLPLVTVKWCQEIPGDISFYSLSKYRANSFRFFFDMLCNSLLPGKRLNLVLLYAADFRMPEISDQIFTFCEVIIRVESDQELSAVQANFPAVESELKLGIPSKNYARRILEIRGLLNEEKTVIIQEHLSSFINRWPDRFDYDLLTEMQHVLVMCHEKFKADRECRHLSRIICAQYLFRKALRDAVKRSPKKRSLYLKFLRASLKGENRSKRVLGVLVGMNFFRDKEVFDQKHLLKAIQNYIPKAQVIEGSIFVNRHGSEHVFTLYLEIEKNNGLDFTSDEISLLKEELPGDLKDRIEHLMHPVFMPRNEEEIMRNILSLSNQIKYLRDIPQVFISFDEQTHADLLFTIILVRVLKPGFLSIQELFKSINPSLEYTQDYCQYAGILRRKYKKEATVFRLKLLKDPFLRADHSIDLNKARQKVALELFKIIGEFRDFNGGMISKQNEVLCELRGLLHDIKYNDLLLENFFYSLMPVVMRNVLDPQALYTLFLMLLNFVDEPLPIGKSYGIKIINEKEFLFILIKIENTNLREEINKSISKLQIHSSQLAHCYVSIHDTTYKGYIYRCSDLEKQEIFSQIILTTLANSEHRDKK